MSKVFLQQGELNLLIIKFHILCHSQEMGSDTA